jgi:hypothetical protein
VGVPQGTQNTWGTLTTDYITPEARSRRDKLKIYLCNQRGVPMCVDDLVIQVFDPK